MLLQLRTVTTRGQDLPWRINDRLLRRYYNSLTERSPYLFYCNKVVGKVLILSADSADNIICCKV